MSVRRKFKDSGYGKHWVTDPKDGIPLKMSHDGVAARPPRTIAMSLKEVVEKYPQKQVMSVERDGVWQRWTWEQYYTQARTAAKAMIKLGLKERRCVSIIGFNSPEWFLADVGAILAGGIAAGIYTTNGPEACKYVADHSESQLVFVENKAQLDKFLQIRSELKHVKAYIMWDGDAPDGEKNIYDWKSFMALGEKETDDELNARCDALKPEQVCTLIYTSGTTGPPKAVMISHDNVSWTAYAASKQLNLDENEVLVSFLPLSHIAAQMIDIHFPITTGCEIVFARPDALKGSLVKTLGVARPTVFLGVPRVWEKIREKMLAVGAANGAVKRALGAWAKKKGLRYFYNVQDGRPNDKPFGFGIASGIFKKVHVNLGLDRCKYAASAAAPISMETLEYFASLNIPIYEIYGMSESTGPETINYPGRHKIGSTGPVFEGAEIMIHKPDADGNGEICFRGRHVFMGYLKNPEATNKTIDKDGWLHSGDVGQLDKDGFLKITGRMKELIITAGGENVPPVLIENEIKKELQAVSQVVVIGDQRKFLSCVLTLKTDPNPDAKEGEYPLSNNLASGALGALAADGITDVKTVEDAIASEAVRKHIEAGLKRVNKLATSNAQKVQKFTILGHDFSLETGEMTPTMKVKRNVIYKMYNDKIEAMYK